MLRQVTETHSPGATDARWWGWGGGDLEQAGAVLDELCAMIGTPPPPRAAMPLGLIEPPDPRIGPVARDALARAAEVDESPAARVLAAAGSAYPDLVRRRRGQATPAPDLIVRPHDEAALARIVRIGVEQHLGLIVRGGGTSQVGGVDASGAADRDAVVVIDTSLLSRVLDVDPISRRATFAAGISGPAVEAALRPYGLTLAHEPQSFERSTLGGWIGSRSASYGGVGDATIASRVRAARLVAPAGALETGDAPGRPEGPDMLGLVVGSEGALGIVAQATVALHARPEAQAGRALRFGSFADGLAAARRLVQEGVPIDTLILADEVETRLLAPVLLAGQKPRRRRDDGALMLVLASGSAGAAADRIQQAVELCGQEEPDDLGHEPARLFVLHRHRWPLVRDRLVDAGFLVDTVDVSVRWSAIPALLASTTVSVEQAIGAPSAIGWQLTGATTDGASLWMTVRTQAPQGAEIELWRRIREAALGAILAEGGSVGGVGSHHEPWLVRGRGRTTEIALRAVKYALDPTGIMNPGKLLRVD